MVSMDKILLNVEPVIIETINLLAKENDREALKKWLVDCEKEIVFRQEQQIATETLYSLHCEKYYLEAVLN